MKFPPPLAGGEGENEEVKLMLCKNNKDVMKIVRDRNVSFIQIWFTDVLGMLKSFAITPSELEGALTEGMGFDGSSIEGFARIEESDMIAKPDPTTFQFVPWRPRDRPVARMFCDILQPDGTPYEGDPRYVLKRILRKTIQVEYSHHEVAPSQHEIDLRYNEGLKMADTAVTLRIVVKEIARKHGVYATFMPKPIFGENGSGMHVHQSLFRGDTNAFHDPSDQYHLSDMAKSYICGIMEHAREMALITNQWVNSYKRLVPGYEAPAQSLHHGARAHVQAW
jgi:glutamine synthetase